MNLSQYIGRGRALLWMLLCSGIVFIFFLHSYINFISQVAIRCSMLFTYLVMEKRSFTLTLNKIFMWAPLLRGWLQARFRFANHLALFEGSISYKRGVQSWKCPFKACLPYVILVKLNVLHLTTVFSVFWLTRCSDAYTDTLLGYANSIRTSDGGSHLDGMKAAITRTLNTLGRKAKFIKVVCLNAPLLIWGL